MADIQTSDVGRKLQDRYDLTGPPPAPFLSPELVPVVVVDDLTQFSVLDRTFERPYQVSTTVTSGVGTRAQIRLLNPAGSGVLMSVQRLAGSVATASQITWFLATGAVITLRGLPRDSRLGAANRGACGVDTTTPAGTVDEDRGFIQLSPTSLAAADFLDFPFVLQPDFVLLFTQQITNDTLQMQFEWTERFLLAGDLR